MSLALPECSAAVGTEPKTYDVTNDVEKYWVELALPQCRRYFRALTDHMLNPEHSHEHHELGRGEARHLRVLLDELDRHLGKQGRSHD